MKPFLYQIASLFYEKYGAAVSRLAFVFPNRRTGLFFQKYLSELSDKPLFSPTILTINDLFVQLSGKQPADRISMLFQLYAIYRDQSGSEETFDEFLYWGEMLLNDFDDIDKYMADARMLFMNVTDLREIEHDFSFLTPEQIEAVRSFWSSFYPKGDSPNQEQFLSVWRILYALYTRLREQLAAEGKGYEGMIFREVVEQMEQEACCELPYQQIVFVGLNALSVAEERFLLQLQKRGIADFYWDYDSPKVVDPNNKASYFVERNLRRFPSKWSVDEQAKEPSESDPYIEVIGVPSGVGQAKQVGAILKELFKEETMDAEEALRTAVILPDEHLLIPVLHAIPEQIKRINVTMGYPLAGTPVASLMEYIVALQKNIRYVDGQPLFYYRDVLPILNHRYIAGTAPNLIAQLVAFISENNKIYISYADLDKTPLLSILFRPVTEVDSFSDYLIQVLQEMNRVMSSRVAEEEEEETLRTHDLEQEFIFHYFTTVNRMKEVMKESEIEMWIDTYFRLLKRLIDTITIPFHGEPLSGLQIMGVLETRALDFDRLIILSMNDGVFPMKRAANSFIPYNLRRGFGLPTYEHQDSVWAYHFYRLIHRASHISLLYDTRSNGLQTGEVSRFVHQLHYHYEESLHNKLVVYNVSSSRRPALKVEKDDEIWIKMAAFYKGGTRAISASAINTYLDCPLKFYFSVIENIQEEEEVSETIESRVFGNILHKVMEALYQPFCGKLVTADLLKLIRKNQSMLSGAVARAFAEVFFKTDVVRPLTGQNFLIGEMIRKYVEKVLERDSQQTPFHYVESEKKIKALFVLSDGKEIQLKGFIDRVDAVDQAVRIIDYKSGTGTTQFSSVEALFDREEANRAKAVMQVFMYAWMYQAEQPERIIQPGIYYMRSLFDKSFDPSVYQRIDRSKVEKVTDFSTYKEAFEKVFRVCLDEIFNPQIPFVQTENEKTCAYCPFKDICGR